jgi:hypothetical protein
MHENLGAAVARLLGCGIVARIARMCQMHFVRRSTRSGMAVPWQMLYIVRRKLLGFVAQDDVT